MEEKNIKYNLLRGHTDTIILKLLYDEDHYGYEIIKLIRDCSNGEYELKEATMYSCLRRLESDGDVLWYWGDDTKGGRRKYFKITEKGKKTYEINKCNWEYAKGILEKLL